MAEMNAVRDSTVRSGTAKKPRRRLTEALARDSTVPEGKSQVIAWDSAVTGFGLRCLKGGAKTWVYVYRPGGGGRAASSQTLTLGHWPAVSAEAARKAARAHAGVVARGGDPASDRREERRRERATLARLLAVDGPYERDLKRRRIVNTKPTLSSLRRGLARLMAKDIADLTRQDLVSAIAALDDAGRPGAAGDLRKHSRTLCEWAVSRGLASANVMAGLRRQPQTRAERLAALTRGRALGDAEIAALWRAAETCGLFGGLVQLAIITALRRGELATLRWTDITADRIVLEAAATKTGWPHQIPLTPLMRAVLAAQPRLTSTLVFPSLVTGKRMMGWTKLVLRLAQASGVEFTMHDLRRTCRTLMSRLDVAEDVAEIAIGHRRADLVGRYNRDEAWARRCAVFAKVSDHVGTLVGAAADGKVVSLPTRERS